MRKWAMTGAALMLGLGGVAHGQLSGLPGVGPAIGAGVARAVGQVEDTVDSALRPAVERINDVAGLAAARIGRLAGFVRNNRAFVELDDADQPARAREVLLLDPDADSLARADASGYRLIEQGQIADLGLAYARLATPPGANLSTATRQLRRLLPAKQVTSDQIHFPGGAPSSRAAPPVAAPAGGASPAAARPMPQGGTVGIIDGGALPNARIAAQSGFATGAPRPNAHAQAIASLLAGAGVGRIYVADVYGADPAGGDALAIAKALGWMSARQVPVVSISLVGPANPLLARAIAAVRARGMVVAAAVGNDGAAAPPAYPASYDGVVAVTGVDGRGRVLFEAGRASHLDYAAPGADMTAIGLDGRAQSLRGTSFAAPLAAARIAAHRQGGAAAPAALAQTDAEAVRGAARTGRGILCPTCRKGT